MADMVIDFSPILAQLSSEVLLEELRRRLGASGSSGEPGAASPATPNSLGRDSVISGQIRSDEFFRLSGPEAIRKYLAIMKRPQSPRAIVEGLKAGGVLSNAKNFYANVWTELKRARERGEIVNTPSGWGLAEWYPNKPKQSETPKPKKRKTKAPKGRPKRVESSPRLLTDGSVTANDSGWKVFLAQARKDGKSMAQAGAEWKARS